MSVTHPKFRVAAIQAEPVFLDLDASIDTAVSLIAPCSTSSYCGLATCGVSCCGEASGSSIRIAAYGRLGVEARGDSRCSKGSL